MFKPDYTSTHLRKFRKLNEDEKELLIAEYQRLRDEVNRTVDRMSRNEVVCAGFSFSLVFFHHTSQTMKSEFVPLEVLGWSAAFLALLVCFYGNQRSAVFRRHLDMVEEYLKDIERRFSPMFGWSNFYKLVAEQSGFTRQTGTRVVFWHLVTFFAFANIIVSGLNLLPSLENDLAQFAANAILAILAWELIKYLLRND